MILNVFCASWNGSTPDTRGQALQHFGSVEGESWETIESHFVFDGVVESDVVDDPSDDGAGVGAGLDASGYLRGPLPNPAVGFYLSFLAGGYGLTLHHESAFAVELDDLSDGHGVVGAHHAVLRSLDFVAHDRTAGWGRELVPGACFVDRPLAGLATDRLGHPVEDVASGAGEVGYPAGDVAVDVHLEAVLGQGRNGFRTDDVHASWGGCVPASGWKATDLLNSNQTVAIRAPESHLGTQSPVISGKAETLRSKNF